MKIRKILGNKYLFGNTFNVRLKKEVVDEYNLDKRERLSQEEYLKVLEVDALSTSYYYLAKRDYAKKELYRKLLEKYRETSVVKKVIETLVLKGVLNDLEYAKSYIINRKVGRKKIEHELKIKGVDALTIREAVDGHNFENEFDDIKKALLKMSEKEEVKKIASLIRKGYRYSDIKEVMKECEEE